MKKLVMSVVLAMVVIFNVNNHNARAEEMDKHEWIQSALNTMVLVTPDDIQVKTDQDEDFTKPGFVTLPCGELQFLSRNHGILLEETMDGPYETDIDLSRFESGVYTTQELCEALMEN